jgi:hypothetical protein
VSHRQTAMMEMIMHDLREIVEIASVIVAIVGIISAVWSIIRTRNKFHTEFMSRRRRRDP